MRFPAPPQRGAALCSLFFVPWLLAASAFAQSGAATLPADQWGLKAPLPQAPPGVRAAAAPQCCATTVPQPATPPVPAGTGGNPEPRTPPSQEQAPSGWPGAGVFTYFKNQVVKPAGARRAIDSVVSPCSANVQDTVLQTGNWYAALSRDTGQTWTDLDPATFFPAPDAGFCCNQRVDYVRSHDLTVWLLQYGYSQVTGRGVYQLAVANGRDELRSGDPSDWTVYRFGPGDFGFPSGTWMDFPDVAFNDDWLYLSSNVHSGLPPGNFAGAVVWRVSLLDLQQNGNATFSYLTDALMGGSSYRFANRAGDGTNMYWAALLSTTRVRVWRQNTIGINRDYVDVTTAPWQNTGTETCQGPDGRGWLGSAVGRIRGACGTPNELVFAWASYGNGSSRPHAYTRVLRLRTNDRSLLAEHDIFNATDCWAYAALDSNSLGHVGGVFAIGGPTRHVRTSGFLIDQYAAWNGVVAYRMADSTNNPRGQSFGSYFDVQRSWADPRTFVASGNLMNGGDAQANVEPHHVWFGRDDYQPVWVTLNVTSSPVLNVPIAIDVTDNGDSKNGTTSFRRTFAPYQGYELTAPASYTAGGTTYVFRRWVHNGVPRVLDQRVLTVANIGTDDDTVEAQYLAARSITFEVSSHITTPVGITVSPQDQNGESGGFTVFTRKYLQGTRVTMTMPAPSVGGHPFRYWRVDGNAYPQNQLSVDFTLGTRDVRAVAEFFEHTPGTFTAFGTGCAGSNGPDVHTGTGRPELGQAFQWRLDGGLPASGAVLLVGASNTRWLGLPLPVPLPNAPGCSIQVSVDITLPTTTTAAGIAWLPITVPNDAGLIGGHVFTQFGCIDLAANAFGLTLSNGIDTRVGGVR